MLKIRAVCAGACWLYVLSGATSRLCAEAPGGPVLKGLSDAAFWSFELVRGQGRMEVHRTDQGDMAGMWSEGEEGMAASLRSARFAVEPNRRYAVRMEVKTEGLQTVDASLTGAPYVRFWDAQLLPSSYQPRGTLAPKDSDWHEVTAAVTVPTTARSAELHLAFAAYGGYVGELRPRESGRARGRLWVRNVRIEPGEFVSPLPATIHVSDPVIQAAIDTVAECLHNSSWSGRFRDSDGYTESENIVPDLSFGLYGVRRQGQEEYMRRMREFWESLGGQATADGKLPQRVMCQVQYPLGVDEIYSFTGSREFLEKYLPVADRALDYVAARADSDGLARLVEYGQWRIGEGADWVDWYPTRMEGKTFNFHQWYVRALRRLAALHEEFAGKPGASFASVERARQYRIRAGQVEKTLRLEYWAGDHFVTNVDYGGRVADEKWLDDQVWAIQLGVASPEQAQKIWRWVDADPFEHEGMPSRWAAFRGPQHAGLTWFGRLGAGDILARYRTGNTQRGLELLRRISAVFARDRNVYEAYTMWGTIAPGTLGWGNYTEHCGGYLWALLEGPFGVDLDSDSEAVATIRPRFPTEWTHGDTVVYLRGTRVRIDYTRESDGKLTLRLESEGTPQPVRVAAPGQAPRVVRVGAGEKHIEMVVGGG